ncbi:hypothetical protein CLAFUW4_10158 [Fulvia fulva]|uniref:ATP-grasp domain-containing protein n=1 Tax=Passalora fulva TaxID=5499 RepID=A0A9Q8LG65_PASFU|nr:uncharacterized protein CLAFUR5_04771 [Fulvia fulva]UJO16895.1 hypothetical protein CLAFUR5_04771 [Fulvia fulva]WPV19567.1 hypothetical protein CLAFUW4_10158 [Fulvia fulva]
MAHLPTIILDTTLSELYKQAGHDHSDTRTAHIFCGVTSALDLTPDFPRNLKYVYQESAFTDPSDKDERFRQEMAVKHLSLVPQRDAFIAGSTPVMFFHTSRNDAKMAHDIEETNKTLSVISSDQRPEPIYSAGPGSLQKVAQRNGLKRISSKLVIDDVVEATDHPDGSVECLVDADVPWYLNCKEALARSGLPTPRTKIIEVDQHIEDSMMNTPGLDVMADHNGFDMDRRTAWTDWLSSQKEPIIEAVRQQTLPFVVKGNQCFAGAGTHVLESESERKDLIHLLEAQLLEKLLTHIHPSNEHLNLGTIMISDMVKDPIANFGMTFFAIKAGEAIFLAASDQMIDAASSSWLGSTIIYSRQAEMKKQLTPIMKKIAAWLFEHRYIGPVGADILQTQEGGYQIIDLNVRTSGSLCLPLMKTHFTSRGLDAAGSISITVKESRGEFIKRFSDEFSQGRMVIVVAWYEEKDLGQSYGDVVVGAEDMKALREAIERVRSVGEAVTF